MPCGYGMLSRLNQDPARREPRASIVGLHPQRRLGRIPSVYIHSLLNFRPPLALG